MLAKNLLLVLIVYTSVFSASAQGIKGKITNSNGEPVSFASIYIPQLSSGTTSNLEGNYELKLAEGKYSIIFQYLGYQTINREVVVEKTFQKLDIILTSQNYVIPEIEVLASKEDPAYYVMRKAIGMAPYYQKQVSKYSCKVYLKGTGIFEKIPFLLEKQMKKGGVKENEPFVMETLSKIDFELPDKVNQQVLAMRSSGQQNNTSPMGMITNNLYDADKYGVVSPVGKTAMKMYDFKLEGVFQDQGRTINKIKVIPKSSGNNVFSGFIFIANEYWNIHSADLKLHIPMTDVNVRQVYAEVNKNSWMPVSLDFDMNFSGFGLKMKYRYVASISEYLTTLNPSLDHTFLDKIKSQQLEEQQFLSKLNEEKSRSVVPSKVKSSQQKKMAELMSKPELNNRQSVKLNKLIEKEIKRNSPPEPLEIKSSMQVSQKQVNNDSIFWAKQRPIPLTIKEKSSFVKKDSFLRKSLTPRYLDSVRDSRRKFKVRQLIFGKTYNYSVDSILQFEFFSIPTLVNPNAFSFNTVDGLRMELPFNYYKADSTGRTLRLVPHMAYAFLREKLDASFTYSQRFRGLSNSWLTASMGTTTADFNRNSSMPTFTNEFYTLFLEDNYKKFYRRDFLQLVYSRDLANGLTWSEMVEYSDNSPLSNHSSFTFFDNKNKVFSPNTPENPALQAAQLESHQTFALGFQIEYTPRNRYRILDHKKIYAGSKYPTFTLGYKSAFSSVFGSDSRFDHLWLGIRQKIDYGFDNHFSWQVHAGKFLNNDCLYFEDFQHFNTQSTNFVFSSTENSFRLLPFYQFSTSRQYAEAHFNFQTYRLILKQLPVIKNTSMSEILFVNYLTTPEIKNYVEAGYGFSNLFLLLGAEVIVGFENGSYKSVGLKVSLLLK
ncbi:MAG: DUF5686 and carboxypeptidase regulatory-like domain-containing protein [Prolixibacteraceae bacterium]